MDINYFMKIQNAYGTKNRREKELAKINNEMSKHFEDMFDTEEVLLNDVPTQLMIIKDTDGNTFKKKIKSVHGNKFNLGDYVTWNGQKWLITLVDVDKKTWNRGYIYVLFLFAGRIQKVRSLSVTFMPKISQNIQMVLRVIILLPLETTSMD